jgi:hypothetical protein
MKQKPILQHELWPGPLRKTAPRQAIMSTKCVGVVRNPRGLEIRCRNKTINGDFLCYACKDPGGYAARLRQAQQEARQRCLEAYPVCQICGERLSQKQVTAGQTRHARGDKWDCLIPGADEPLAQRTS